MDEINSQIFLESSLATFHSVSKPIKSFTLPTSGGVLDHRRTDKRCMKERAMLECLCATSFIIANSRNDFMQLLIDMMENDVEDDVVGDGGKEERDGQELLSTFDETVGRAFVYPSNEENQKQCETSTMKIFRLSISTHNQEKTRQSICDILIKHNGN